MTVTPAPAKAVEGETLRIDVEEPNTGLTCTLFEAGVALPPLLEVGVAETGKLPGAAGVNSHATWQLEPPARDAPLSERVVPPAARPLQVIDCSAPAPRELGRAALKPTPVSVVDGFGLLSVKISWSVTPSATSPALKPIEPRRALSFACAVKSAETETESSGPAEKAIPAV